MDERKTIADLGLDEDGVIEKLREAGVRGVNYKSLRERAIEHLFRTMSLRELAEEYIKDRYLAQLEGL